MNQEERSTGERKKKNSNRVGRNKGTLSWNGQREGFKYCIYKAKNVIENGGKSQLDPENPKQCCFSGRNLNHGSTAITYESTILAPIENSSAI